MAEDNPFEFSDRSQQNLRPQPNVDASKIIEFSQLLDTATEGCDTVSQLCFAENGGHGFCLVANRSALLRLAALMLRLACEDPGEATEARLVEPVTHEQILIHSTDTRLTDIRHTNSFPDPVVVQGREQRRWWMRDRVFLLGCSVVGFVLIGLLLSGLAFWSMVLSGQIR